MQIGIQVFCDTALILKELERRYPDTNDTVESGYRSSTGGVSDMIATWVDVSVLLQLFFCRLGSSKIIIKDDRANRVTDRNFNAS